jgi:hypothetical protein
MDYFGATLAAALLPLPADSAHPGWSPSSVYSGWVSDGTSITVPIASFPGLTAATADGISGDARVVIYAMCYAAFTWYNDVVTKPEALEVTYAPGRMQSYGDFAGEQKAEFKFAAYLNFPELTLADEPA